MQEEAAVEEGSGGREGVVEGAQTWIRCPRGKGESCRNREGELLLQVLFAIVDPGSCICTCAFLVFLFVSGAFCSLSSKRAALPSRKLHIDLLRGEFVCFVLVRACVASEWVGRWVMKRCTGPETHCGSMNSKMAYMQTA